MGSAVDPMLPPVTWTNASRFRVSKLTFISAIKSINQPSEALRPKAGWVPAIVAVAVVAEENEVENGKSWSSGFDEPFSPGLDRVDRGVDFERGTANDRHAPDAIKCWDTDGIGLGDASVTFNVSQGDVFGGGHNTCSYVTPGSSLIFRSA